MEWPFPRQSFRAASGHGGGDAQFRQESVPADAARPTTLVPVGDRVEGGRLFLPR